MSNPRAPASLADLTLAEAARRIGSGDISPVDLVEATLERIERLDGSVHAFITVDAQRARAVARAAESRIRAGGYRAGIDGIPLAVKDNIETAGLRTTSHSRLLHDHIPDEDAHVITRIANAGGIVIGKTSTWEFAQGRPSEDSPWPHAANPWSLEHQPGGSSSGSGAAVAAHMVSAAVGTDTGGSIRFPAACCGIVGLKPTYGRVSRRGLHPNTFSLDACGPLARTVEDCAILLDAMAGHDPLDPGSIDEPVPHYRRALTGDIGGTRIGLVRHWYASVATPEVEAAVDAAAARLRELGAIVEEVRLDPLQDYVDCKTVLAVAELYSVHERDLKRRPQDFGASLRSMAMAGALLLADDYIQALRWRTELASRLLRQFEDFDALLTAGWMSEAEPWRAMEPLHSRPPVTMPFNIAGNPAISVPCGFTAEGLPLAMQLAAKPFDEATVLRVADAYERASGFRGRVAPLVASRS